MRIVAIDPGVHMSGIALIVDGKLASCAYRASDERVPLIGEEVLIVERPQIDGRRVRAKDLLDLAFVAGTYCAKKDYRAVTPAQWKGSLPKNVAHARLFERVPQAEIDRHIRTTPPHKRHNVYDAVALGLWAHDNFKKLWPTKR